MEKGLGESANVDETLFRIGNYRARRLLPADLPFIRTFNQQCSDFFMLQNGAPPNEAEAEEIFNEVPPGRRVEDKLSVGVFDSDCTFVSVIDALRNYRIEFEWWIGLMLVAPASRNAGLGSRIHDAFENHASACGAKRLLLAVLEVNTGAHRFWSKLGYRKVKDHPPKRYGCRVHAFTEYEKTL
jgi:GNAT superfamily N-acetyltransferase